MSKPIYFFKDYLLGKYGFPLYRVPVDIPFGCPNRDINNNGGCIFCAESGARARHLKSNLDLPEQVKKSIKYVERRYHANGKYIAYFQSYSNTNASVSKLREYYEEVLSQADFKMVIISTRPDCLPDDVLEYLRELSNRYELWIELGVQTSNEKTLKLINRGHNFKDVKKAAEKLAEYNIKTVAHVILGLPGEKLKNFRKTIHDITTLPFNGIKIHNLLVLKKTQLAKMYRSVPEQFNVINEFEYAGILIDSLRILPPEWPVMRLNADAPEEEIIAPKWHISKGQFIELIRNTMQENGFKQGDLYNNKATISDNDNPISYLKIKTDDESFTFYHPAFKQNFHTLAGAATEATKKFVEPSGLADMLTDKNEIKILDIGFGLGYNAIAAIKENYNIQSGKECIKDINKRIIITSLEFDRGTLSLARGLFKTDTLEYSIVSNLLNKHFWTDGRNELKIIFGDARDSITTLNDRFDIVFLDGFSTDKNPELWTYDFIKKTASLIKKSGCLVTYSSAFPVRGAFIRSGLFVGTTPAFGRRKGGTIASFDKEIIKLPLPVKETGIIIKSTAGAAYRDVNMKNSSSRIFSTRDRLIKRLRARGIPKWYTGK